MKKLLLILFSCFISLQVSANEVIPPDELIRTSINDVMEYMKSAPSETVAREAYARQKVEDSILGYFDFLAMTKLAVGKYWRRITEEQQQVILEEFKELLVRTYVKVLAKYTVGKIDFLPYVPGKRPDRAVVKTSVKRENGGHTEISYKLRLLHNQWLVYDVKVEGISLVTNYRTSFSSEIARRGVNGLIRLLKDKNMQKS